MHEFSIALYVLEATEKEARKVCKEPKVKFVKIKVGKFSNVVVDSLKFCLELASRGTCADGARFMIESESVQLKCSRCGEETCIDDIPLICLRCGSFDVEITKGDGIYLERIELEDGD